MSQLASPVEIYWISGSPFAWRVLLTAEVKGIPYEGKLLEASKGELKTPEFLAKRISEFISDFWPPSQRLIRSIFFGPPLAADDAKDVREKIDVRLARLEGYAEGGVWMAGPDLTAADIVAYPSLKILLRASQRPEAVPLVLGLDGFETRFPGIATWMQQIEQLPGYEKTYPPHWRQT